MVDDGVDDDDLYFNFRYQQYISNSGRNLPDRDCMVQQEYEVDVEETYEPEKVCSFFAHLYLASYNQGCGNSKIYTSQGQVNGHNVLV